MNWLQVLKVSSITSYRTTIVAVANLLGAAGLAILAIVAFGDASFDNDPATQPDPEALKIAFASVLGAWVAFMSSLQGLLTRDAVVSSQQTGIRK